MPVVEFQPLLSWLSEHPSLAGLIAGVICFCECFLLIGLFIPNVVVMTALGSFVGTGAVSFFQIAFFSILGSVIGDSISFWIGYRYQQGLRRMWPFSRYSKLLERGEVFFQRFGAMSIFLGHFIAPVRAFLPTIAGMLKMPACRFLPAELASVVLWVFICMFPGVILGRSYQNLSHAVASKFILLSVLGLFVLWILGKQIKFVGYHFIKLFEGLSVFLHQKSKKILFQPSIPSRLSLESVSISREILLRIFIVSSLLTLTLIGAVIQRASVLLALNQAIHSFVLGWHCPFFDVFFSGVSFLGGQMTAMLWLVIFAWLLGKRESWVAIHWAWVGILTLGVCAFLKYSIQFLRPCDTVCFGLNGSFPSGHVLTNLVLGGFVIDLLTRERSVGYRWLVYSLGAFWILILAFSRLYVGAHWMSDVLGAFLIGGALLSLITYSYRSKRVNRFSPNILLALTLCGLIMGIIKNVVMGFPPR